MSVSGLDNACQKKKKITKRTGKWKTSCEAKFRLQVFLRESQECFRVGVPSSPMVWSFCRSSVRGVIPRHREGFHPDRGVRQYARLQLPDARQSYGSGRHALHRTHARSALHHQIRRNQKLLRFRQNLGAGEAISLDV